MKRRALLRSLMALTAVRPWAARGPSAQPPPEFGAAALRTLRAVADVGLPSALDGAAKDRVVASFAAWHRNYRENADRGHGYGSGRLSPRSGPAPARRYPPQFASLDAAAVAAGAASFAAAPPGVRRAVVERALNEPQPVNALPGSPNGNNLVADFLGFYFNSADAWDLSYQAAIRRDSCRALDGSDQRPARVVIGVRS